MKLPQFGPLYSMEEGVSTDSVFLNYLADQSRFWPIIEGKRKISYYNIPAAFDIETSSFYADKDGENVKMACMYHWQFGIGNKIIFGRTWEKFRTLLNIISRILNLTTDVKLIVYVHNLPYEFQFIRRQLQWESVFLFDSRRPLTAKDINGIEFRDSLRLFGGKSLANVAKDLQKYPCKKLVGDLDYSLIRHSQTPLTQEEKNYCENDVRILLHAIQEKIEQDGDITKIPLTSTGYVREYVRNQCFKNRKKYTRFIQGLTMDTGTFVQLRNAYQGGYTHANVNYVDLENPVTEITSYDLASAYPSNIVLERFPMSKFTLEYKINSEKMEEHLKKHACLFDVTFTNLYPIRGSGYPISISKCWEKSSASEYGLDNGRVVWANKITTTCTEQDWAVIKEFYVWDSVDIFNFRYAQMDYLPLPIVLSTLHFYEQKTKLKGIKGKEMEYGFSKALLNSIYGMMVTNPIRDIYEYDTEFSEYVDKQKPDMDTAIDKYNKSKQRFLYYAWGVWITAYTRGKIFSAIINAGEDFRYSDTDSIKMANGKEHMDFIEQFNADIFSHIEQSMRHFRLPRDMYCPKDPKGAEHPIGIFEHDGEYDYFKTLGAKRYLTARKIEDEPDDFVNRTIARKFAYSLTCAGVNKKTARDYLVMQDNPWEEFTFGAEIPSEYSGRLVITYVDEPCDCYLTDYLGNKMLIHEETYSHMENSDYNFANSPEDDMITYLIYSRAKYDDY